MRSNGISRDVYVIASEWPPGYAKVLSLTTRGLIIESITKVGIAESPEKRLKQLQCDSPLPLRLVDSFRLPYRLAKEVEELCHNELAPFLSHGEWFKVDPKAAWECVQKHGNAVMLATNVDHTERRRREDWLRMMLEQECGDGLTVKVNTTDIK